MNQHNFAISVATSIFAFALVPMTVARAATIEISNISSTGNGAYALVDESGSFLSDPPARVFAGGFSSTYGTAADITTAFFNDFSTLAADFTSIHDIGIESDGGLNLSGLHNTATSGVDPSTVIGRNYAIWITLSGTINDSDTQHLIYLTSQTFAADPLPSETLYSVVLRPAIDGGNGTLAVGGVGNFTHDYGFGEGAQSAFNTVAVPEPSSFLTLAGGCIGGFLLFRRRKKVKAEL